MTKDRRRVRGFTLVEMLLVMAVVALLTALVLPRYLGSLQRSKEVTLEHNLQVLRSTLDKYFADKGRYPDSLDELVQQHYLRAVPVDPITESSTSWILERSDAEDVEGVFDVRSGAQGTTGDGRAYETL